MSSKRPPIDLMALTNEQAQPMTEAVQRLSPTLTAVTPVVRAVSKKAAEPVPKTANLEALAFKVSPAFRDRFKQRALDARMKLNELLFAALDAWEEKQGVGK